MDVYFDQLLFDLNNKLINNYLRHLFIWCGVNNIELCLNEFSERSNWIYISLITFTGIITSNGYFLIGFATFLILLYNSFQSYCLFFDHIAQEYISYVKGHPESLNTFLETVSSPKLTSERLDWFNDILSRIWPFINNHMQREIDRGEYSEGLKLSHNHIIYFERFTLGDKPPVVTSIEVKKDCTRLDELVIDLKLLYFGNCLLGFYRKSAKILKIKAGVKDIYFQANGRIVLRPLINSPPFFGGLLFTLLEKPILDYDGINLANFVDSKMFRTFLLNVISSLIVSPNNIAITFDLRYSSRCRFRIPIGLCVFQLLEASLPGSALNVNCAIYIGEHIFESSKRHSNKPYWGDTYAAPINDLYETITINVYSGEHVHNSVTFKLADIAYDTRLNGSDNWLPLGGTGRIHFRCAYFNLTNKIRPISWTFPISVISVYVVEVFFKKGSYCPLIQLKISNKTLQNQPYPGNKSRLWIIDEAFHFTSPDPLNEVLNIAVINQRRPLTIADITRNDVYGTLTVSLKSLIDESSSPDLMITGRYYFSKDSTVSGTIKIIITLNVIEMEKNILKRMEYSVPLLGDFDKRFNIAFLLSPNIILHPIKSIKRCIDKGPIDIFSVPDHLANICCIKLRLRWSLRDYVFMDLLRISNIPNIFVDERYKYSLWFTCSLEKIESKECNDNHLTKGHTNKLSYERLNGINKRFYLKICGSHANHKTDDYSLYFWIQINTRQYFCFNRLIHKNAVSGKIKMPSMGFRTEPIELWFPLSTERTADPAQNVKNVKKGTKKVTKKETKKESKKEPKKEPKKETKKQNKKETKKQNKKETKKSIKEVKKLTKNLVKEKTKK